MPRAPVRVRAFARLAALVAGLLLAACHGDEEGLTGNIGSNDANVVVALGDSITHGGCVAAGAPYPARLAGLIKKNVINGGSCGAKTGDGAARVTGLLQKNKAGTVLVLLGANDIILSKSHDDAIANLRAIIGAAKAHQTRVAIATVMPMIRDHAPFEGSLELLNIRIRALAKSEKVKLVDLFAEFAKRREALLQEDGLHPSDAGTQAIAAAFADLF